MALSTNGTELQVYIRVELPRIFGKHVAQFDLVQYIAHPFTSEMTEISKQTMECEYSLEGPNVFEQCYQFAKNSLPFETIDC